MKYGIVLDRIKAGRGMESFTGSWGLIIWTARWRSSRMPTAAKWGARICIKIDRIIDIDLDAIGYVDPGITVNIIKDKGGELAKRTHIDLPEEITNVIHCKNPRCITTTEQELPHVFELILTGKSECTGAYTVKVRRNKAPGSECRDAGWAAGHCGSTEIV